MCGVTIIYALWPVSQESGEGVMWSILLFLLHVWTTWAFQHSDWLARGH